MNKIFSKIGGAFNGSLRKFTPPQSWYNFVSPTNLIYDAWSRILCYSRLNKIFDAIIPKPSFVERVFLEKNCNRTPSIIVTWCLTILIMITACFIAFRVYSKKQNQNVYKVLRRDILDVNMLPESTDQISCGTQINLNENFLE